MAILIIAYNKLGNISHIMLAARNNPDPEVIRKMVLMGQNIEGTDKLGSYTPLYFAMKYNPNPNVAIMLINLGANINHITLECQTPLLFLLEKKDSNINIIKLLCDKGAYVSVAKYDSDEEYKNKIAFNYFLENNRLPSDSFEKCINGLSHEELEAYKENDIKVRIKVEDCIISEYSTDDIISTSAQAKIMIMEEDTKKKMSEYGKNIIRKKVLKCMEDKISKLSEEELQEFKNNAPDSEILQSCIDEI